MQRGLWLSLGMAAGGLLVGLLWAMTLPEEPQGDRIPVVLMFARLDADTDTVWSNTFVQANGPTALHRERRAIEITRPLPEGASFALVLEDSRSLPAQTIVGYGLGDARLEFSSSNRSLQMSWVALEDFVHVDVWLPNGCVAIAHDTGREFDRGLALSVSPRQNMHLSFEGAPCPADELLALYDGDYTIAGVTP